MRTRKIPLNTYAVTVTFNDDTSERFRIIALTTVEAVQIGEDLGRMDGERSIRTVEAVQLQVGASFASWPTGREHYPVPSAN